MGLTRGPGRVSMINQDGQTVVTALNEVELPI